MGFKVPLTGAHNRELSCSNVRTVRTRDHPLLGAEFNRSTQHYSPKLSGVGLKQFLH